MNYLHGAINVVIKYPYVKITPYVKENKIKLSHVMDAGLLKIILIINKLLNSFLKT